MKDSTETMLILGGVAVAGYFLYKSGAFQAVTEGLQGGASIVTGLGTGVQGIGTGVNSIAGDVSSVAGTLTSGANTSLSNLGNALGNVTGLVSDASNSLRSTADLGFSFLRNLGNAPIPSVSVPSSAFSQVIGLGVATTQAVSNAVTTLLPTASLGGGGSSSSSIRNNTQTTPSIQNNQMKSIDFNYLFKQTPFSNIR